ncbi:hypothetical protein OCC47_27155 [Bacillus cereus]|nr:hypothetical protein [Bacillus cereus]
MKYMYRRFITINLWLRILLLISIISVLFIDLYLIHKPELFKNAAQLGTLYRNLCFAYITSFLFFFWNVHLQNYNAKVKSYQHVDNKVYNLRSMGISLILSLEGKEINTFLSKYPLPEVSEIFDLCYKVDPNQPIKFNYRTFQNWFELSDFINQETRRTVNELLIIKDVLDAELMTELINLTQYVDRLNRCHDSDLKCKDLAKWAVPIWDYAHACSVLSSKFDKKYRIYRDESRKYQEKDAIKYKRAQH